jgi:hypothetical protein
MQKNVATQILKQKLMAQQAIKLAYGGASAFSASPPAKPSGATYKPDVTLGASGNRAPIATSSVLSDMGANSARVGGGILGTLAGGLGTVGTGAAAGATNAWNALAPQKYNTSPGWTAGINNAFDKSVNFTQNSVADVTGGLNPTNLAKPTSDWQTNKHWNQLEQGWNDPSLDPTTKALAQAGGYGGHAVWNAAQIAGGPQAFSNVFANGAQAANTANTAVNAANAARTTATATPAATNAVALASRAAPTAASTVTTAAAPAAAAATSAAAPAAAPAATGVFSAKNLLTAGRAYGNATGVFPTSGRGLAMSFVNPMLQQGAQLVDNKYDTNFSGRHTDRNDASTLAGQVLFPTQRAYAAVGNLVGQGLNTPVNEAGDTVGSKGVEAVGAATDAVLPGGRSALDPTFATSDADRQLNSETAAVGGQDFTGQSPNPDPAAEFNNLKGQYGDDINNWPPEAIDYAQSLLNNDAGGQQPQEAGQELAQETAPENTQQGIPAGQPGFSAQHLPDAENIPPETVQQLDDQAAQFANDPAAKKTIEEALADPNKAEETAQAAKPAFEQQITEEYSQTNPQPENPQDWGAWANGLMEHVGQAWSNMGPMGQLAFGLGMPLGLIGVLGGGLPGFLLAAVGLGAAGATGAIGGMFGPDAQSNAAELIGGVGTLLGGGGEQPEMTPTQPQISSAPAQNANPQQASTPSIPAPPEAPPASQSQNNATQPAAQPAVSSASPVALDPATKQMATDIAGANMGNLSATMTKYRPQLEQLAAKPDAEIKSMFQQLDPNMRANLLTKINTAKSFLPMSGLKPAEQAQLAPQFDRILKLLREKNAAINVMRKAARCWSGYEPVPGKKPYSEDSCRPIGSKKKKKKTEKKAGTPAWQRSAGKNEEGGLNAKGRASYHRETGGTLKAPVTESNPKGERAKRQNSFCSRMCGMKRVNTGSKTKSDPDSRINKSLRKWNCKCSSAIEFGAKLAQLQKEAAGPACRNGVCPPATPKYSKTPFDRAYAEAAFKQHGIPFSPKSTDQQLYNLYLRKGAVKPGQKMNPFQAMVGAKHDYLPPAPIQPTVAQPTRTTPPTRMPPAQTSTDIDPPTAPRQPAPPQAAPTTVVGAGQPGLPKPTLPR